MHSNLDAINAAWRCISELLNKTAEDCKLNWKSLRDSKRYHVSAKKKRKSGMAACDEPDDINEHIIEENNADFWEYASCLSFLTPVSNKRRTFTSSATDEPTETGINSKVNPLSSSYSYQTKPQRKDPMLENVTSLTQTIKELVEMRKCEEEPICVQPSLENYSLLANLDRILKQLPKYTVEKLGVSFQQQALAELEILMQ